jgi:isopenicillin-N N-acyltransferase-like protein
MTDHCDRIEGSDGPEDVEWLAGGMPAMEVLELRGTPRQRGETHGEALRPRIHSLLDAWRADVEARLSRDPQAVITHAVTEMGWLTAAAKWCPDLLEEVQGLAAGAALTFEEAFALQLIDELWAHANDLAQGARCTSVGALPSPGTAAMVAQNMDLPAVYRGHQTLLHIVSETQGAYVLTASGLLGLNGVNAAGVALACNSLLALNRTSIGVPVVFVVRSILAAQSANEAVGIIRDLPHATGQNYMIGDADGVMSWECSAAGVTLFRPRDSELFTYHTNHPLASRDVASQPSAQFVFDSMDDTGTQDRLASVRRRVAQRVHPATIDWMIDVLAARDPGRKPVANDDTFACTVMRVTDESILYVAPGRAKEANFSGYRLQRRQQDDEQ